MSTKRIILISGFARSGKDTLANALLTEFEKANKEATLTKFANALKSALQLALNDVGLGHIDVFTEDTAEKELIRPLFVEFGKYCRAKDKNVFVNRTLKDVDAMLKQGKDAVVISDCRYLNEAQLVRAFGANELVNVDRFHIVRRHNNAANDEEANSIAHLNVNDTNAQSAGFEEGMVHHIEWWAKHIVQTPVVVIHGMDAPDLNALRYGVTATVPENVRTSIDLNELLNRLEYLEDSGRNAHQRIDTLHQDHNSMDTTIDRVSQRVDHLEKFPAAELRDAMLGIKLGLERMEARLRRLEIKP